MNPCYRPGDFKKYFEKNMKALGLPVPGTLFDSYQTAVATATTIVATLATLGKGATVAELVGATVGLEKLMVAASFGAAAYVGAVIGSIAVATGRSLGCGSRLSDLFIIVNQYGLKFKGMTVFYSANPQVLDSNAKLRNNFGIRAKASPSSFEYS